jgi:hypothetical protein
MVFWLHAFFLICELLRTGMKNIAYNSLHLYPFLVCDLHRGRYPCLYYLMKVMHDHAPTLEFRRI